MSFKHLYAGRKHDHREIFTNDSIPKELLFIKPQFNNKKNSFENYSIEELYKQLQITKSNLRLPNIDEKGKQKLTDLANKYQDEINRRLSSDSLSKIEVKSETTVKEEIVKTEQIEDVQASPMKKDNQPIFHVSDDLLSKIQSLSIDPHKNMFNIAKNSSKTISKKNNSTNTTSAAANETEKTLKFLSLEESAELVKQKKFVPKSIMHAKVLRYFSNDEDDDEDEDDNNYDSDDEHSKQMSLSDDDSQMAL